MPGKPDVTTTEAQFEPLSDYSAVKLATDAERIEQARSDVLTFTTFLKDAWTRTWSTNSAESLNRESWRRTDAVGILLNREGIICLVSAILTEQTDEWGEDRLYLGLEVLVRCRL